MESSICVVAFSGRHLPTLVKLLSAIVNDIYAVPIGINFERLRIGRKIWVSEVIHKPDFNLIIRLLNYIRTQFKVLARLIVISKQTDTLIFFVGGESLLIPILFLRLSGKTVILLLAGSATRTYESKRDPLTKFLSITINVSLYLSDKIIIYSPRLIREMKLSKHRDKITIAHEHFVDFTKFFMKKRMANRSDTLGYIGRLSEEKGILKLIEAIPLILKERPDVRLIICGDGNLVNAVEKVIRDRRLEESVKFMGEIPHKDVPYYLNEIKLLVLPSFTEGLPNIVLEAMACGTPVLATSVGAIPDVIKEGETGFLLKSNDPKHIAEKIMELLKKPNLLRKVSINAYNYVRENFSYEKTLETWRKVLNEL